jgi:predicted Zn-dependent protease
MGADMRHFIRFLFVAAFAFICSPAFAQFGLSLPGFGKGGEKGSFDLGGMVSNLTKATRETSEAEEIRIGQEFAATLLGAKPLVADARLQQYVNTLGRWLALQTERPDLPWTFGVLDDAGFNAFATPGGYIFVTQGLVARMRNEAELVGVLAHEIAHVLKKHHLHAVQKNAGFALVGDLVSAANKGGNDQAKAAFLNIGRKLYSSGLDQGDEFEADRLGVVIAARAGYDAYGLPAVLQMLHGQNAQDGNFSLLFKTHPAPNERIELLGTLMHNRFDSMPGSTGWPLDTRLKDFVE